MTSHSDLMILIDGHSLAFRAYYAFSNSRQGTLRTSNGIPTSVCFGFINSLTQVIESQRPKYIVVAFDLQEPSFRHQADEKYKATRKETPEEFITDLENLKSLLSALNLQIITAVGYEADDVLGTLAQKASKEGYKVKILTGDRDLFQLVDSQKNISVLYLSRNFRNPLDSGYTEFDELAVEGKLGVKPTQVVDYKALCGDTSDNIPGVKGIGEKTAVKLLQEYETLDNIYQNIEKIQGSLKTKLVTGKEDAKQSRFLAQLMNEIPIEINLKDCLLKGFDTQQVKPILEKLELKTFIKKIEQLQESFGGTIETLSQEEPAQQQLSIFPQVTTTIVKTDETTEKESEQISIQPQIIDTPEKLNTLINHLKKYQNSQFPVAWDTETTSLKPRKSILVGIGCCWGTQLTDIAYIPLHHTQGNNLAHVEVLNALREILESDDYPKAFQNTKFDRLVLKHQGINLVGVVFDTMLASYVLHPEKSHNLSDLSERYLSKIQSKSYKQLAIPKGKSIADLDIITVADYCGMDAYATYNLVAKLQAELEQVPELSKLLSEVEQPLEAVLAAMEDQGVRLNVPYLKDFSQQLEKTLQELEIKAYEAAGETFNLASPKQLSDLLFVKLGLNTKKTRKIKTGYSTDHATLEKLQGDHPVIDYILEQRTLAKLKSTYVDALPKLIEPKTNRVHTDFNQTVTTTGRLSSSNPNLQNIPIRSEFSRRIRQAFIPDDGYLLVSADYSQIELRILAHLCQEPVLVEAYRKGEDVHAVTAKLIFEKDQVTPLERNLGKTINFGVIYGMGAQRFARESGLSVAQGKEFIEKYQERYAKVFKYLERVKKEAISLGYVQTILGRRRYFDFSSDLLSKFKGHPIESINLDELKIHYEEAQLLRAAANAPIQGSSADIIKIAMIKLHSILQNYQAKLLLQVHDELVLEVPVDEWQELEPKIKATMENAVLLSIPLVVEVNVGKNWMEAK
ncbi:DNA polymerase I [Aphanothece hegewaldii CCALA 016]|uniref:DNA polymerase I n=1 Tax=Aphanothece hegewaldii CCALA 016 TaxID=2107694 RepID=A0A2T1M1A1_9CHRO|nr:DNA polymerase I [Aphanothece hegewaldii]PSF38444.1 DNA polymerase I [Aphanothece hegewaldii CCALA 016]